ncbi:MAG TPA: tRNA lysidine(34) synthetase TilS [Opitutaceae bacterium]
MKPLRSPDWPAAALALAAQIPRERLQASAWAAGERLRGAWAVAFSGGADSLALLLLLWAHWPERRARLVALHFNHRLRGRASQADEAFCRRVCAALQIPIRIGQWKAVLKKPSEADARKARHGFFQAELRAMRCRGLWLGHQLDDVAESMLMRLARGSGLGGLAAPRPVQAMPDARVHLRPLLTLRKDELAAALTAVRVPWREDATNVGADYFRNRVRAEVIPRWVEAAGRDALAGAGLSRSLIDEDDAALDAWVEEIAPFGDDGSLDLAKLVNRPVGLVRRALRRWLNEQCPETDLSRQGFDALLGMIRRGERSRFSLGNNGFAVIARGRVTFEKASHYRTRLRS